MAARARADATAGLENEGPLKKKSGTGRTHSHDRIAKKLRVIYALAPRLARRAATGQRRRKVR